MRQRGGDARVPSAPAQSGGRARASAGREPPSACGHEPRGEEPLLIRTPFRGLEGCDPGSRGDGALGMLLRPRSVAVLLVLIWGAALPQTRIRRPGELYGSHAAQHSRCQHHNRVHLLRRIAALCSNNGK